jgi:putative PEP-CTERM system histidine kinase
LTESALANASLWSYGVAAICFAGFAVRLALGWRSSPRAMLLLGAIVATALWAASGVAVTHWPGPRTWLLTALCDALRYALWFAVLSRLFLREAGSGGMREVAALVPRWVAALVAIGLVVCVILAQSRLFTTVPDPQLRTVTFGISLALAIFGLILVEQVIRRAHPQARWAIKPLCVGLAGIFAFDLFFFADAMLFGRYDADVWVVRGFANALVIPFIAVATARNPGWTIEMHMSRGAVFHSTAIVVSGFFLLAIAGAGYFVRFFGGEWGRAFQIAFSFAALLVTILVVSSGRFRSRLRVFVSKHFFSYRFDYREEWLRFTRTLSSESSTQGVHERSIQALADLVESPSGALWLDDERGTLRPAAHWNQPALAVVEPSTGSLVRFLGRTGWVIDLAEYRREPARYPDLQVPMWLTSLPEAWLVVPLVSGTELLGFAVLANSRAAIAVDWEVRDLLKTASRQAASYLRQIQATEALLEARKFDAFNRMSAFVVHDLKNLVAQLSLMLRNAERHRDNPEFQRDMLSTVEHVVTRMNNLMLQLRTGATPMEKPRPTDLESVVRRVCATKEGHRAPIELDLTPGVYSVGHEDRLDHVIAHLVQNALDATAETGGVSLRLRREGPRAVLEVADTGVGMTPEFVRDRLFKPFETSKASGMGIGVYESSQYVSGLGGEVLIDSEPGVGTRVRVMLPAADGPAAVAEPAAAPRAA